MVQVKNTDCNLSDVVMYFNNFKKYILSWKKAFSRRFLLFGKMGIM